jgi:hypothetical protein
LGEVLKKEKEQRIKDSLTFINDSLTLLKDSLSLINAKPLVFSSRGQLFKSLEYETPFLVVKKGTEVLFVKDVEKEVLSNCLIIYDGKQYYTIKSSLMEKGDYQEKLTKDKLLLDTHNKELKVKEEARLKNLTDKYGRENALKIISRKIWIGMTKEMLMLSWGTPDEINRTVMAGYVKEQCIYGSQYVYVENDIVTAWQD